jgi:hypothetical protein
MSRVVLLLFVLLLAACGSKPRQPDWLVNADGEQDRFERAYLQGDDKAAATEFALFRRDVASTAQPGLVARAELTRCAVRIASLEFTPCSGFEPLRRDAGDAERAYADFLAGATVDPAQAKLLPADYRAIASGQASGAAAVRKIKNPLSQLVASAVLLRTGRADPEVLQVAADTASQQGWRRAVLAWLGAQAMRAQQAGDVETAQRLRRRMDLAAPPAR